ncbi:hypothetical protein EXIGLDRAFT_833035 [Exidia glandulosa HHB12029]|uniref:F-box domain-containing protein n=1 Tax=Exidia glandulosa HHB12029 TaxID=1314781 RepID=A0A165L0X1_EXIGL|nr:hypothetical protein EXIGLDRAFT_833035 [Exidia glandulosa HHB12029]
MELSRFFGRRFKLLPASSFADKLSSEIHSQGQSTLVRRLPSELIVAIFESCDEYRTAACLALTCKLFWDLGRLTVERQLNIATDWTGDRLACIGDYAAETVDELPKGILNDSERAFVDDYIRTENCGVFGALMELCSFEVPLNPVSDLPWIRHRDIFYEVDDDLRTAMYTWLVLVEEVVDAKISPEGMVLPDLTARQYIRGNAFIAKCQGAERPLSLWREWWDLQDLIILGICYSSHCTMLRSESETSLLHGLWSGHRFDVVEEKTLTAGGWKDVSDQLLHVGQRLFEVDCDCY